MVVAACRSGPAATDGTSAVIVDAVRDFGAVADGTTNSEPMLQAALDAAAKRGGGTVNVPEGTYGIAAPLILRSRVHLVGAGRGKTVLRSLVKSWTKIVDEAEVYAAVAMVAADSASVRMLTVDFSASATHSNGIVALPAGAQYEGTPSTRCEISQVEVIGGGNYHAYMIWNLRGRDIRIVDNVVDGGIPSHETSHQEGIESYGGRNVHVTGNVVRNVGGAGLNFGSAGLADTSIEGLVVTGNTVTNVNAGLVLGTARDRAGPQDVVDVRIENNEFANVWSTGVYVPAHAGTEVRDVYIGGNRIRNVGAMDSPGRGVHFQSHAHGAPPGTPETVATGNVVERNVIENVRGPNAFGVFIVGFPNLLVADNDISHVHHSGVRAVAAENLTLERNRVTEIGYFGFQSSEQPSRVFLRDNLFRLWDRRMAGAVGASIHHATAGEVRANIFEHETTGPSAVRVESSASNVVIFGNRLLSEWTGAAPFVNLGANSNLGSFALRPGARRFAVLDRRITTETAFTIEQTSGTPLDLSVVAEDGMLIITFGSVAEGGEQFRYAIDP